MGKKVLKSIAIPLVRDNLPGMVRSLNSSAINKFERKTSGKGAVRAGKRFILFISNEDMNDIIKIIKLLNWWSYSNSKKWKWKTRRQISWSFGCTFNCFIRKNSNFFSSKMHHWKRSCKSKKRIHGWKFLVLVHIFNDIEIIYRDIDNDI